MLIKHTHRLAPRRQAKKTQPIPWSSIRTRETTCLHSPPSSFPVPDTSSLKWPTIPTTTAFPAPTPRPLPAPSAEGQSTNTSHHHHHHHHHEHHQDPPQSCSCNNPSSAASSFFTSIFSLCRYIPLQRFGNSLFPTPLIVLLRLIFPAASLSMSCRHASRHDSAFIREPSERAAAVGARWSAGYLKPRRERKERGFMAAAASAAAATVRGQGEGGFGGRQEGVPDVFAHLAWRVSVQEFVGEVERAAAGDIGGGGCWRVVSITWVKALASHMSHEFVQFVVQDTRSGVRRRLIADRQETGDWVSITPCPDAPMEMSEMFKGLGSKMLMGGGWWEGGQRGGGAATAAAVAGTTPYRDRHTLPLPLVSLVFDDLQTAPTLGDMAALLADVSLRCKEYNPLREHCWWFSEAVVHGARMKWESARLEEWKWSRYRYSFVICNRWIRRRVLETAARRFEQRCLQELAY